LGIFNSTSIKTTAEIKTVQVCKQLRCEVCGRKILGSPFRVVIEGAKLTVCGECSKHGKVIWEEEPKPKLQAPRQASAPTQVKIQIRKPAETRMDTTQELVEGFDLKIRQAREKMGLSQEELGKRINEKVSLLRKIETGKIKPDDVLSAKLERILKIKLLVPFSEEKTPQAAVSKQTSRELTFGDIAQMNKKSKGKEEPAERKSS
jgi:putative transcription factor